MYGFFNDYLDLLLTDTQHKENSNLILELIKKVIVQLINNNKCPIWAFFL